MFRKTDAAAWRIAVKQQISLECELEYILIIEGKSKPTDESRSWYVSYSNQNYAWAFGIVMFVLLQYLPEEGVRSSHCWLNVPIHSAR